MPEVVNGAPAPAEDPAAKIEMVGQGLADLAQASDSPALKAALEAFSAFAQELQGGAEAQEAPVDSMGGQGVPMDNRRPS